MKKYIPALFSVLLFFLYFNNTYAQDIVANGGATKPINFPTGPCIYTWTNDNTSIGLAANGAGNIPSFTAINTGSSPVTATIIGKPVGTGFAYVVNAGSNSVSMIDLSGVEVSATIPVGSNPNSIAVDPNYNEVYVVNNGSASVSVISTLTNKVIATVAVGITPWAVTAGPDGSKVYVADGGDNEIDVIDATTNTITDRIPAGTNPNALAISPDGSLIYVNNHNSVLVINTSTHALVATIPIGTLPQAILITPDGSKVYEANYVSGDVDVINTATNSVDKVIPVGATPGGGAMSPDGSLVYIANEGSGTVSVISTATNTVIKTIAVGTNPWGVSVRPDGSQIYVANSGSNNLSVIDAATNTVTLNIPVGSEPYSFGNFFTGGMGCSAPVKYTITVNPANTAAPVVAATSATGNISACAGTASVSPNIQQFTVSGGNLTGNITATAPPGFEVSLALGSGYGNTVTIPQTAGAVSGVVVYVRSAASAAAGSVAGSVTLTSAGATDQTVAVAGTVNAPPNVNAVTNQSVINGASTAAVSFTGTASAYTWVNDTPGIGLAARGTGNIASFTAVNMGSNPVKATITVTPVPAAGFAYITNIANGTLSVVKLSTGLQVDAEVVGQFPGPVRISADGTRVYVANNQSNTVTAINTATNMVIANIPAGVGPSGMAITPDGGRLYVTNQIPGTVSVLSTVTNTIIATINVGNEPLGVLVSADGSKAYVGTNGSIVIIDTSTNNIIGNVAAGWDTIDFAQSPDGKLVYVSNYQSGMVSVINTSTNTVIATIPCGNYPYNITMSPDGNKLYVANSAPGYVLAGSITVINTATNTVDNTININFQPDGIDLSPGGDLLYVLPRNGTTMLIINTADGSTVQTIPVSNSHSSGHFISAASSCPSTPIQFTITVNSTSPTVTVSPVTGVINACAGAASASPNIQQFTVSGSGLTGDITATAPTNFEISLAAGNGYGGSVTIPQISGGVSNVVVYVRSAATSPAGAISGNVTLTTTGAINQTVAVNGSVNALPAVNAVANQTVVNGVLTTAVNFTGTGNTFTWVNDTPGIGLAAGGSGNIASFMAVNNGSSPVTATITVTPTLVPYAYVANYFDGTVSAINLTTNQVTATIPVGNEPYGVAASPDGSRVYVTSPYDATISVINTATNSTVATITGFNPEGVAVSPDGRFVYVADANGVGPNYVGIIDAATNKVLTYVTVSSGPFSIALSADGSTIYVANLLSNTVSVINSATNQVLATINVGLQPKGLVVSPDGLFVYVANSGTTNISVISTATNSVAYTIATGANPQYICISPDGSKLYFSTLGSKVLVMDTSLNAVIATVTVPGAANGVDISPDGGSLYVTNGDVSAGGTGNSNTVTVINTSNYSEVTIPVGSHPVSFGNFISKGTTCGGVPVTFTITVNPTPTSPTITTGQASGTISACAGAASASPNIQQFTVSGSGLTGNITATAPANFEVSFVLGSGYGSSVTLVQSGGVINSTVVYIRAAATAPNGNISGNVTLTSPGAPGQTVAVAGSVNPVSTASVTIAASENNVCASTSITFTATPNNGGGTPAYQWLVNGSAAGANSATFSTNTLANGDVVTCVMTSSLVCTAPATSNGITMNLTPTVTPTIGIAASQNNICTGTPVTFTATANNGGSTPVYQWQVNGNNAGTSSATFSSSNLANGDVISCMLTSNAVCATPAIVTSNSITIGVTPFVSPAVTIAASQNNICTGTNVTFTATPTDGGVAPVYQWLLNGSNAGTNSPTFASSTLANGDVISCQITSNAACLTLPNGTSNNITMSIIGQALPAVTITASVNNVCAATPITFTATPTNGGNQPVYQWLINGANAGTNSPDFASTTLANGDVVTCTLTSSLVCATPTNITSNSITMAITPLPVVDAGTSKTIKKGNSTTLTATASGSIADITWSPTDGLENNKLLTPKANPTVTTLYTITVQNTTGCMATDTVTVNVFDGITIPNTFTPNGDGINDKWDIQNLQDYRNCDVHIFDRWGAEVFSSIGYYNPWDGTYKGKRLPFGTYYYVINLKDGTRPLSGFVALIR